MILLIFHNAQIVTNYEELVLKFVAISIALVRPGTIFLS